MAENHLLSCSITIADPTPTQGRLRACDRILKVAHTITDHAGDKNINSIHISKAVQYRTLDRKPWV